MVHISLWSDVTNAIKSYNTDSKALEIALHGYKDLVMGPEKKHIVNKLKFIKEETKMHRSQVRAAGIEIVTNINSDLANVQEWIRYANETLLNSNY